MAEVGANQRHANHGIYVLCKAVRWALITVVVVVVVGYVWPCHGWWRGSYPGHLRAVQGRQVGGDAARKLVLWMCGAASAD